MLQTDFSRASPHDLRRKFLATAVAATLTTSLVAEEAVPTLAPVTVTGQAAGMDSALDVQQMADNIVSVVHSDAIGQLPDANTAEALQRVPGVSVERDQGEGRYVRVRGLGPDLNSVTINGALVPSPESGRRAVQLDVLPSTLIRSLEVVKTLTPDMDANSLGGTVNVTTFSAFDHKGMFYSAEGGMSHDENLGANRPNFAAAWSNRFLDGKLGVALGLSAAKRRFGSDNVETGGEWDFSGAQPALNEFQRRDYAITRERQGFMFNLEYRPQDGDAYYLRTLHSRYNDEETRQRHNIEFDNPMLEATLGNAESSRELKTRKEKESITSITLGGEKTLGDWKVALALANSVARQNTPNAIDAAKFESGSTYTLGYSNGRRPELIGDVTGVNNVSDYQLDSIELSNQSTTDRERNARLDLTHKLQVFGVDSKLKFGGKVSRREKTNALTAWEVDGGDFGNPSLSGFAGESVSYPYGTYGSGISTSAVRAFLGSVNLDNYVNEEESRINDFIIREDINAGYVQNTFNSGLWRVLVGVRYEGTRFRAEGTGLTNGVFSDKETQRSYRNWLPALHARRDLDNDTSVRAALTHAVVRPTFEQLAPGFVIDGTEASFGNPNLDPIKSRNLDLGIEHRLGYAGVLSAYVFHKDIKNFVYNTDLAGSGAWTAFTEANTFANGKKASVRGIELNWMQTFRHLSAPWNGLILSANATFSHSKAQIDGFDGGAPVDRQIALPGSSKRTVNLTVGYEQGPVSVRLAANHKSRYLLEVGSVASSDKDLYVDPQTQLDFSLRYRVGKQVQLVFEAINLTDEKYYVYTGRSNLNAQYESYGRTYKVGVKIASF